MDDNRQQRILIKFAEVINQKIRQEFDERDAEIAALKKAVNELRSQLDACREQIGTLRHQIESTDHLNSLIADLAHDGYTVTESVKRFIEDYNRAAERPEANHAFRDKYGPEQVEVIKRLDRAAAPRPGPNFAKGRGDYWVVPSKTPNHYLVIPRIGMIYDDGAHQTEAMSEVFEVEGYFEGGRFPRIRLIRPAIFTVQDRQWTRLEKGAIRVAEAAPEEQPENLVG
jgi:polyhydroxyalkanoate synthesis regulator phasin